MEQYHTLPLEVKNQDGSTIQISAGDTTLPGFTTYQSNNPTCQMSINHFAGNNYSIWYSRYQMKNVTTLISHSDLPILELHIPLSKTFQSTWDGYHEDLPFEQQYDISYAPFIKSESKFLKDIPYATYDVHYDKSMLERHAHIKQVSLFLNEVEKNQPASLLNQPKILTPNMTRIIKDSLSQQLDPALQSLYYESTSIMLLTLLLNQLITSKEKTISTFEKESTYYIKAMIAADITRTYSVAELCRLTGINEIKLQNCFRQLFGTTVFSYLQELRMEHARKLLLDTTQPIRIIAVQCGYTDHSNFTAAFKKHFSCTPDALRKKC